MLFPEVRVARGYWLVRGLADGGEFAVLSGGFVFCRGLGVVGDLSDGVLAMETVSHATRVFRRDMEGTDDEVGALVVDGVAHQER